MEIIESNISNVIPNFTRFICISKDFLISDDANTIAVTLELPNSKGSLYRLLTKFFVNNMNLEKIENRPIADGSFDVIFYLDFTGNINNPQVKSLLTELNFWEITAKLPKPNLFLFTMLYIVRNGRE